MPLICSMLILLGGGCAHGQHEKPSSDDLLFSFELQRNGGHLNELQMYVVMLERGDYEGLRAALRSSQDSDILTLCQDLACERGHLVERDAIRAVIRRIADHRALEGDALGRPDPRVDKCIAALLESAERESSRDPSRREEPARGPGSAAQE